MKKVISFIFVISLVVAGNIYAATNDFGEVVVSKDLTVSNNLSVANTVNANTIVIAGAMTVSGNTELSGNLSLDSADVIMHPSIIKGWCSLTGTGTIAIRSSYNVTSITDNGTGDYTVTWDTDFSDTYYCTQVTGADDSELTAIDSSADNVGSTRVLSKNDTGSGADSAVVNVLVIGNR